MAVVISEPEINISIRVNETNTSVGAGGGELTKKHVAEYIKRLAVGTAASQANIVYGTNASISAATNYDLNGLLASVVDSGTTFDAVKVVGFIVINKSTTSGEYLTVGAGTNDFDTWTANAGDQVFVGPDGFFATFSPIDGFAVTAATADILRIVPATGTIALTLLVLGRSA